LKHEPKKHEIKKNVQTLIASRKARMRQPWYNKKIKIIYYIDIQLIRLLFIQILALEIPNFFF